jgi:radical SAM enzyme (TIGR01210 family)
VTATAEDQRIRSLRSPKASFDPYVAHGSLIEEERRPGGTKEKSLTVFLTGAECPFTCSFCDLWKWTIDGPTPPGALATQLRSVIDAFDGAPPDRLKLYNASNFFDPRAVPTEDLHAIAALAAAFPALTVESHASTIGDRTLAFADRLQARLEVAMGLETIHPTAAANLNKRLDLGRFDSAATFLTTSGIDLRVFILLGAPYVPAGESIDWTLRTIEYAVERGASMISIIPVRGGNGEMERLRALGQFLPPTLHQLEETLDRCSQFTGVVVSADLWDVERLSACDHCREQRIDRIRQRNSSGFAAPRVDCAVCGG